MALLFFFSANLLALPEKDQALDSHPANSITTSAVGSGYSTGGYIPQVIGSLLFILMLIAALAYAMKRFQKFSNVGSNQLQVLEQLPLGVKEKVILIEACGKPILLGITANNINTLHVFDDSSDQAPLEKEVDNECVGSNKTSQDKPGDHKVPGKTSPVFGLSGIQSQFSEKLATILNPSLSSSHDKSQSNTSHSANGACSLGIKE
ncbi:flagellar biosynthetic protein FliO [Marinibactrum halimedae]|uniref:Flagellar protein n=1 Tax=Marinibactrum halimedae TaxID=1444977 RepID=A0AA37T1X9_9GAMM|nr:flagellar biosynthetic protein FliO [Marinibactrum halimedae]MCD9459141.1 flagellar biosynthetic protein FliO [Marinibactrum halimedae]GLS24743.1 hypothetical protein GCM10007877_04570 [Marinibactrum halimedae]